MSVKLPSPTNGRMQLPFFSLFKMELLPGLRACLQILWVDFPIACPGSTEQSCCILRERGELMKTRFQERSIRKRQTARITQPKFKGGKGFQVEKSVTINRSPEELWAY